MQWKHKVTRYFHFDNQGFIEKENNKILYKKRDLKTALYFEENSIIEEESTLFSKHYNELDTKPSLKVEDFIENNTSLLTVIKVGSTKLDIIELDVKSMRFNNQFWKWSGKGFFNKNKRKWFLYSSFCIKTMSWRGWSI